MATPPPPIPPEVLEQMAKEDRGPTMLAISYLFTTLALISVVLRFITRIAIVRHIGIEDVFMGVAMVLSIGMAASQVTQVHWGAGKHIVFLEPDQMRNVLIYAFVAILTYCASLTFTKLSILLQYRRIFTYKEMRMTIYIIFGICVALGIESVLTGIFTCVPVDAFWNLEKQSTAICLDRAALYYANAGLGIATDVMVAVLPVKAVWSLRIPKRQKIALVILLTLGLLVCIVSVVRLTALHNMSLHPEDPWYGFSSGYWSCIEVNLAIVCGSAPVLKPLITRFIPQFASRFTNNGATSSQHAHELSHKAKSLELRSKSSAATLDGAASSQGKDLTAGGTKAYEAGGSGSQVDLVVNAQGRVVLNTV
ncbi:hypothetical protein EJ04DRAFT_590519 [Polyplosphaeria fusca]|uniref:Rhodopsin domain-containing protein n=1 Tax=Polyplosphaeria fusca TaxID=682080 RepID=A0A9P4R1Q7_9PLEO|nr:hypothetical protein EJ04DRAFT_590519 [Polyplosphaeria fusca]